MLKKKSRTEGARLKAETENSMDSLPLHDDFSQESRPTYNEIKKKTNGTGKAYIQAVAGAALRQGESLLRSWLPGGKLNGDEYTIQNPVRSDDEHVGNFKVNVRTSRWADFASNDPAARGNDWVSLYGYLNGLSDDPLEAAKQVAEEIGYTEPPRKSSTKKKETPPKASTKEQPKPDYFAGWRILSFVPDGSPAPPENHRDLGTPSRTWAYQNPDGFISSYVYRFDLPDGNKETRPLTLWVSPDGSRVTWRWKGPEEPRPIYHLNQLYDRPDAPVLVVEGEKAACAAADLLPSFVATTSPFGSKSPDKADWSILKGREVTIWPDRDGPGEQYAVAVARLARAAGAVSIRIVNWNDTPTELVPSLESGMDIADLENKGWSVEQIAGMVEVARAAPDHGPAALAQQEERIPQDPESVTVQFRVSDETRAMLVFENVPDLTTPSPKDGHATVVESHVAERLAPLLRNKLARCEASQVWHYYDAISGYWHPLDNNEAIYSVVESLMAAGLSEIGYSKTKKNGAVDLLERKLALPKKQETGLLPFRGSLLNVTTGELIKTTPDSALRWVLPYPYSPDATCPSIDSWLLSVTGGDELMVHYLLCWLAAILRGVQLQRYLHLIGSSRTGKGLFMRMAKALVGNTNTATTTLERMSGRFESSSYIHKRLLLIPDSKQNKKGTEAFKMLIGGDPIPNEQKFGKTYHDPFQGICIVASNESIAFGDHSDAIFRRRCVVNFDRVVSDSEIAAFHNSGGEGKLFSEIPGLANRLLRISTDEIRATLTNPPPVVIDANREEEQASNPIAKWVFENLIPCPQSEVTLGVFQTHTLTVGDQTKKSKKIIEHADDRAFPNFVKWCGENGVIERINPQVFARSVVDAARSLKQKITNEKTRVGRKLVGVRLRTNNDDDPDLVWFGKQRIAESPFFNKTCNETDTQGNGEKNEVREEIEEPEIEMVDLLEKRIDSQTAKTAWGYIRLTKPSGILISELRERMQIAGDELMPALLELDGLRLVQIVEGGKRVVKREIQGNNQNEN